MAGYQLLLRWLLLGAAACPSGALIGPGEEKTTAIFLTSSGGGPVVASSSKKPATIAGRITTRGPRLGGRPRPADANSGFASCKSRRGAVPDMEPLEVLSSLSSPVQCLAACLLKSPRCKGFAFGNRSCDLLQRSPCDSRRPMRDAPGFAHYDVLTRDQLLLTKGESQNCPPVTTSSDASTTQPTVPPFVTPAEDRRRKTAFVFRAGPTTFDAAQRACLAEGLAMAMPVSSQDHKDLVELMRQNRAPRLWIGVQRSAKGNTTFMNGEQVPESSRRWGKGQPNNSGGTQICVEMIESLAHLWNDYDCENRAAYACQQPSGAPQSSNGPT
ncbi:uncharacterized protein LOC119386108 [Rhipicephalus sanguineus]|uniref:uncharacterized protein LOC119386108 n=1 Tax=Rhipicephalus sanguineus TaxID=34632 RepID=UPI0020C2E87E|nr:uncharacterized protein LOC119386108 [Rhipicephalus sanguineus]